MTFLGISIRWEINLSKSILALQALLQSDKVNHSFDA